MKSRKRRTGEGEDEIFLGSLKKEEIFLAQRWKKVFFLIRVLIFGALHVFKEKNLLTRGRQIKI